MLLLALLVTIVAALFQIGNMIADFTRPTDLSAERGASYSTTLAPTDPLANWLKASVEQDKDSNAVGGFETVVRLSPEDYRWWIQLGRSYEQAGKSVEAESALTHAVEIAPNYVVPKWHLGNFYLRQGEEEKAMKTLRAAAKLDPGYRDQIFGVVWDFYEKDSSKVESLSDGSPIVQAGLAKFYAAKGMGNESLAAWRKMSKEARNSEEKTGRLIAQALYDKGLLLSAAGLVSQIDGESSITPGKITNAGFEETLSNNEQSFFEWKINPSKGLRVRTTGFQKKSGKRSLELSFTSFVEPDINNVYQTVALEGGKDLPTYVLSLRVKALHQPDALKLQIVNAKDSKPLDRLRRHLKREVRIGKRRPSPSSYLRTLKGLLFVQHVSFAERNVH